MLSNWFRIAPDFGGLQSGGLHFGGYTVDLLEYSRTPLEDSRMLLESSRIVLESSRIVLE